MNTKRITLSLLLLVSLVLSACSNYKFKESISYEVDSFKAIDHRGNEVNLEQLKGEPWLAMFVFTNCTTICSPMTYNMSEIQQRLIDEGVDQYKIIGFSVDPDNDSPEIMAEYLARHTVPDETKWHYVSGYDQKFIEQFAKDSFKTLVRKAEDQDQVTHGSSIYLVDEKGVAVKYYTGYSADEKGVPMDNIVIDLDTLIEERLSK